MSERVREILSWYGSDNPGTLTNLARLLNSGTLAGTGRFVILPVDQGVEHGPARSFAVNPDAYDPRYHFELAIAAGCNAYAAPLGFIEAGAREFAGRVPLILKTNNHDVLLEEKDVVVVGLENERHPPRELPRPTTTTCCSRRRTRIRRSRARSGTRCASST